MRAMAMSPAAVARSTQPDTPVTRSGLSSDPTLPLPPSSLMRLPETLSAAPTCWMPLPAVSLTSPLPVEVMPSVRMVPGADSTMSRRAVARNRPVALTNSGFGLSMVMVWLWSAFSTVVSSPGAAPASAAACASVMVKSPLTGTWMTTGAPALPMAPWAAAIVTLSPDRLGSPRRTLVPVTGVTALASTA